MADTVITAVPFTVQHPLIKIGATGSSVEISCPATHVTLEPNQDENTVDTFCGSYTTYKKPVWTLTTTIALSYGTGGVYDALYPLMGTLQPWQVQPDNGAPSASNPNFSGTGYVQYVSVVDADPGGASEVDCVIAVQGAIVKGITAPAMAEVAAEEEPAA